jgi:hypothetical protein
LFQATSQAATDAALARAVAALAPVLAPLFSGSRSSVAKRAVAVLVDAQAADALAYFRLDANDLPCARFVEVGNRRFLGGCVGLGLSTTERERERVRACERQTASNV